MKKILVTLIFIVFSHSALAAFEVYRGVGNFDSPDFVKARGGFFPRGSVDESRPFNPPSDISLYNHATGSGTGLSNDRSGYVSVTTSRQVALNFIRDYQNYNGYIYTITATANFVNVNEILRNYSPHPAEMEYAALGVIHWWQVTGWYQVRGGQLGSFTANRNYNERFVSFSGSPQSVEESPSLYNLAGFPENHPARTSPPWSESSCPASTRTTRDIHDVCEDKFAIDKYESYRKMIISNMVKFLYLPLMK